MTFSRETFDAFDAAQDAKTNSRVMYGYIGKRNPTTSTYDIFVPDEPGMVYVRVQAGADDSTIYQAVLGSVPPNPQLRVRLENINGTWTVTLPDPAAARRLYASNAPQAFVAQHTHSIGSGNAEPIESRRFIPGLVYPSSSGVKVNIEAFDHNGGQFPRTVDYDLASSVPGSAGARWAMITIDERDNSVTVVNGTIDTNATQTTLLESDLRTLQGTLPLGRVALAGVALEYLQTSLSATSRIVDLRQFLNAHLPLNRYDATTAPGTGDDALDGYSVGSLWFDTTNDIVYACLDATAAAAVWQSLLPFYETIQDNGTPETQRAALNFADNAPGAINFVLTDDAGNDRTDVQAELDIEGLTEELAPDPAAFVVISDGGVLAKAALSSLPGGGGAGVLNNLNGSSIPGVNDDELDGYAPGSIWIRTSVSPTRTYICRDATAGAAVWEYINRVDFSLYGTAALADINGFILHDLGAGTEKITLQQAIEAINLFPQTLVMPDIDDFTSAQHDHEDAAGGGTLDAAAIATGAFADARLANYDARTATMTNKTLTLPTIGDFTNAQHDHEDAAGGGTLNASAIAAGLLAPARRFSEIVVTSTGSIDNLAINNATVLLMNNATDATIRGIAGGVAGQRLTIVSIGAGNVYLAHQNAGSSAANRLINMVTSVDMPLVAGKGYASYVYDATTARWRMVDHFQGGVIAFDMTWTSSGTAPTLGNGTKTSDYEIQRNMCFVQFVITMGSTTTYGTGTWLFVMPITRVGGSTRNLVGQISDASAGLIRQVMNTWNSAVNIALAPDSASNIGPTVPWTWATSDTIAVSGWYRIA